MPNHRAARLAAVALGAQKPWYPPNPQFAWSPWQDTDAANVDPSVGGQMTLRSTAVATPGPGLWYMNGANYAGNGMNASISFDRPFLVLLNIDKYNHGGSSNTLFVFGSNGVDSVAFGTTSTGQPRFVVAVNSVTNQVITQNAWSPSGTQNGHWCFVDLTSSTDTVRAGTNQTQNATSGKLTLTSGRTMSKSMVFGNSGGTTGIAFNKLGDVLAYQPASGNMSFSDAMAMVAAAKVHGRF